MQTNTMRTLLYKLNLITQVNKFISDNNCTDQDWSIMGDIAEVLRSLDSMGNNDDLMYNIDLQSKIQIMTDILAKRVLLDLIPSISKDILAYFGK